MYGVGADTMEMIGLPPGASRSDLEVGSLQARVGKYKRVVDEAFPPSGAGKGARKCCPSDCTVHMARGVHVVCVVTCR